MIFYSKKSQMPQCTETHIFNEPNGLVFITDRRCWELELEGGNQLIKSKSPTVNIISLSSHFQFHQLPCTSLILDFLLWFGFVTFEF